MKKRMLILVACGIKGEEHECNSIGTQAKLYDIEVIDECVKDNSHLAKILSSHGTFDYIYLSSHGNTTGFGSEDGKVYYNWNDFGSLLCSSECMNDDCIIMLSCCRAGLKQVAFSIFSTCSHVSYVVGPRQSLTSKEMHISFGIFLYNVECRNIDPVVACEKIKTATDIRFSCYDVLEVETEYIETPIPD